MKILIISVFFPPENSIASLRPFSWAKYWSRAGHDVTVLTTKKEKMNTDLDFKMEGFNLCELDSPIIDSLRKKRKAQPKQDDRLVNKKQFNFKAKVKHFWDELAKQTGIFHSCRFPDITEFWLLAANKWASSKKWDLVVSTAGPYTVHRIAAKLKKSGQAKMWIADYRDLWVDNHIFPGLVLFRYLEKFWESSWMAAANKITTVSEPLADILRQKYGDKVHISLNGFDIEDMSAIPKKPLYEDKVFRILYSGSIYKTKRDPSPLFSAVKSLKSRFSLPADKLQILFAGNNANMEELASQFEISENVKYLGTLPRHEILHMQQSVDLLLFLEYDDPKVKGILTGKLFEYLFAKPYILGVGISSNSSVGEILSATKRGAAFGNDVDIIEAKLEEWINNGAPNVKLSDGDQYLRSVQAEKLLALVKD